ncbi:hypothetical protein ABIE56_003172 [Luteibacter sp. 621]|uniref:hypothetical protein n=1 Tax=Luteibacter sp. 621 TaxID=3373916 RepID=UPI003D1E9BD7
MSEIVNIDRANHVIADDQSSKLTFSELNRRIGASRPDDTSVISKSRSVQVGAAVTLTAGVLLITAPMWLDPIYVLRLQKILLAVQLAGACIVFWLSRSSYQDVIRPYAAFAEQLDADKRAHFDIINWLLSHPRSELAQIAAMCSFRRERLKLKLPLFAGSIPKLGFIPVIAALYLQAREFAAGRTLTWVDSLFLVLIGGLYLLTWSLTALNSRLECMDMYLQAALDQLKESDEGTQKESATEARTGECAP